VVHSRVSQLDFNYTPPPRFDTWKVNGLIASLLALRPEDHGKSTALKIAAATSYTMSLRTDLEARTSLSAAGLRNG